jgi:hypothetical protein
MSRLAQLDHARRRRGRFLLDSAQAEPNSEGLFNDRSEAPVLSRSAPVAPDTDPLLASQKRPTIAVAASALLVHSRVVTTCVQTLTGPPGDERRNT